jgi:hypothetical protein
MSLSAPTPPFLKIETFSTFSPAAELKVTQYDGPTECDEANKVKSGDLLGMHYTGTIVCSFFSTHHLAFACGACPTAAH